MTRPFARGLTILALLIVTAGMAEADEAVRGDGYEISIPGGFHRMPASECGT